MNEFAQAIEALLAAHCTPAHVRAIEGGSSAGALAAAIEHAGFHELLTPEAHGGGGATWRELHETVMLCGAHALPLPLAQTWAARAVASQPSQLPPGLTTFAPSLTRTSSGALQALHVPTVRTAAHVIGAIDDALLLLKVADAEPLPGGVAGSLTASLRWPEGCGQPLASALGAVGLQAMGAMLHAGLMAGAMTQAFKLTMAYANTRQQFGKPIGKFQAIAHQLSVMAEHVAAARMAVQAAFACDGRHPTVPACAVAKARAGEAAQLVCAIAHAVHGAFGITAEYELQLYTRRLHEWRLAHGSESHWHEVLGQRFVDSGDALAVDFIRSLG